MTARENGIGTHEGAGPVSATALRDWPIELHVTVTKGIVRRVDVREELGCLHPRNEGTLLAEEVGQGAVEEIDVRLLIGIKKEQVLEIRGGGFVEKCIVDVTGLVVGNRGLTPANVDTTGRKDRAY